MKNRTTLFLTTSLVLVSSLLISCKNKKEQKPNSETVTIESQDSINSNKENVASEFYIPQSTDEQTANNLKVFLKNYVKDDYAILKPIDKQFEFYKSDLNDDGNDEIFVRLNGPYFCGSGGCTFLLLDKYGEVITKFTVMRPPIFIEPSKVNEWALLLVRDSGVFKELRFENGSYPTNPSVLPKAPYDAPSGHAQIMFDDEFAKSKPFEF